MNGTQSRIHDVVALLETSLSGEALEAFDNLPDAVHYAVRDGLLADEDWQGKLGRMEAWLSDEDLAAAHQWLLTLSAEERELIVAALGG